MRTLKITNLNISHNAGINAEQSLRYFLHGYTTAHDNRRFDKASDIDNISVKSARFTLAQGGLLNGSDLEPMLMAIYAVFILLNLIMQPVILPCIL